MKLKKTKIDHIDLTAEEKKEHWAKEMIEKLSTTIPIMTGISKNAETTHFSFVGLARHASLAESLIYKSNRYRTTSEVYRAAQYIGMSFLYQFTKDEGTAEQKARADIIYKTIQTTESIDHAKQVLDAVTVACKNMIDCWHSGVIDAEQRDEKIETLVGALPVELQGLAREKVKRITRGENIMDISETKLQRGTKKL